LKRKYQHHDYSYTSLRGWHDCLVSLQGNL
jgi:hypothetical protein